MKLDTKALRYLTNDDWKVLEAVERGSHSHELVPTAWIMKNSRGGIGVHKCISNLAKANLIARMKNAKYDGYRLTYGGLDYLALHTHTKKSILYSVGNQIGVGKESDIFVVASPKGEQHVLKIHRLGRISFRTVKTNRDYLKKKSGGSWMDMSRLAAMKEYTFMNILRDNGVTVPRPVAQNRHTIVMEMIDAFPLRQISEVPDPAGLYAELLEIIMRLGSVGLIHGDFNEFNILIKEEGRDEEVPSGTRDSASPAVRLTPVVIDFPQMISMSHVNAEMYFNRDVDCIKRFFSRRFGFTSDEPGPFYADAKKLLDKSAESRLDAIAEASGFSKKMAKDLEAYMREHGVDGDAGERGEDDNEDLDSHDGEHESNEEDGVSGEESQVVMPTQEKENTGTIDTAGAEQSLQISQKSNDT